MPLLKSLICFKGFDNGRRFLFISFVCYFLLVLLAPVLSKAAILVVLLILTSSPILAGSSIRRIRDAGFSMPLAAIPLVIYWLNFFGITYLEHGARWALLVLGAIGTIAMATISNARIRHNHDYQMGYDGPVNLTPDNQPMINRDRIEPTIAAHKNPDGQAEIPQAAVEKYIAQEVYSANTDGEYSTNTSWEHRLGLWFKANQKISIIGLVAILIFTLLIVSWPSVEEQPLEKTEAEEAKIETTKARLNKVEMPDQFWLMLDQNDSLTIGWEGDFKSDGLYWSATTGKGDKDCVDLHFSLGEDIRTLLVTVKNSGDYYADFSPVDTETIIKSIADKDRFKLCGYEFTLKGTRSILRKNQKYREYLEIE